MTSAYIVDIIRTPVGKYGGALSAIRPDDLASLVISALLDRNTVITGDLIEDVIFGAANQAGEDNRNVARMAALLAGLPVSVAGVTVNRLCASGLQALIDAHRSVCCDEGDAFIAGGVESMSRAPFVLAKHDAAFSRKAEMYDTTLGWRFINPALSKLHHPFSMGETAEHVAEKYQISREDQDKFALRSQEAYQRAFAKGSFKDELIPVKVAQGKATAWVDADEHPRQTSLEKLASLPPAFKENGTVTAGNSSGINDGAAAALVVSEKLVRELDAAPMVRIVASAVAGVDPAYMGIGPVPAVRKVLKRANLKIDDIDLIELNEAFASQALACVKELSIDIERVNVNGGSIAIGHPLGCSGVRISTTLIYEMKRRKVHYGLATMCVGVGQGVAVIYENV